MLGRALENNTGTWGRGDGSAGREFTLQSRSAELEFSCQNPGKKARMGQRDGARAQSVGCSCGRLEFCS